MQANSDFSTWRVLVVDDEPDNLHLASEILTFCGAKVAQVASGSEALETVMAYAPNVILLDLAMPGMSGFDVHAAMRAQPALDGVPIIALTALAMTHDAVRVREAGFNGYITKPFHVRNLMQDIAAFIEAFHTQKQQTNE